MRTVLATLALAAGFQAAHAQARWPRDTLASQLNGTSVDWNGLVGACSESTPIVTPDSVAFLRPTRTRLSDVLTRCHDLHFGWFFGPDAPPRAYPALVVRFGTAAALAVFPDTLPATALKWVVIRDPTFKTPAGVGPQSTFGQLKATYGTSPRIHNIECQFEALFESTRGMWWTLDYVTNCDDRLITDATRIREVTVTGR